MTNTSPRPVTIAQVAAFAGVSQASVSRVLNRNQTVDPAIAAKVRDAVEKLNYSPSPAARNLVRGRSNTIALVVPDLENPMFQGVLKGLSRAAYADGYRVLVADTAERVGDEEEVVLEARSRCDALVLVAPRMSNERLESLVSRVGPVVVVNRPVAGDPAAELSVDYESGIRALGEHFISLGHTRIAYLSGPPQSYADVLRRRGLAELVARHDGFEVVDVPAGSQVEDGYRAADAVLASGATGAIAFNDLAALGLLARLREVGVEVPVEISVAGIDDIPLSRFSAPSLTTMSVPRVEIGEQAWQRLKGAIAGAAATHPLSYRPILEARGSTGPVPTRGRMTATMTASVMTAMSLRLRSGMKRTATPASRIGASHSSTAIQDGDEITRSCSMSASRDAVTSECVTNCPDGSSALADCSSGSASRKTVRPVNARLLM